MNTQPRRRIFTKEFSIGDEVAIIRHEHGWEDGAVRGVLTSMHDHDATVKAPDGAVYHIHHCRDLHKERRNV